MTSNEFRELYTKHAAPLHAFVQSRFREPTRQGLLTPEDAVHGTFERLLKTKAYVNRNATDAGARPGRAPVWLIAAVRNTAMTMFRAERGRGRWQRRYVRTQVAAGVVGLGREYSSEYVGQSVPGVAAHVSSAVLTQGAHRADEVVAKIERDRALDRLLQVDAVAHEAAILVYADGLTWAEAAKGLGTGTPDALRVRVARALKKIRDEQA